MVTRQGGEGKENSRKKESQSMKKEKKRLAEMSGSEDNGAS